MHNRSSDAGLSKVFDNYESVFGEDALTKQDLLIAMNELYEEELD